MLSAQDQDPGIQPNKGKRELQTKHEALQEGTSELHATRFSQLVQAHVQKGEQREANERESTNTKKYLVRSNIERS
jgi:hypothetical protein